MLRNAGAMPHRLTALLILAVASVFACTFLLLQNLAGGADISSELGAGRTVRDGEYHAVLLLQPTDCRTRLEVVHALAPARNPRGITAAAVIVGPKSSARQAMQMLRSHGNELPVHHRTSAPRGLRALGYTRTPFVIVFDSAGRVRLATPAPTSAAELRQLEGSLAALSGIVSTE